MTFASRKNRLTASSAVSLQTSPRLSRHKQAQECHKQRYADARRWLKLRSPKCFTATCGPIRGPLRGLRRRLARHFGVRSQSLDVRWNK